MRRQENTSVKKAAGDKTIVYCHEDYAQELYDFYRSNGEPCRKDTKAGEILRAIDFRLTESGNIEVTCDNSNTLFVDLEKEKRYLDILGTDEEKFKTWVQTGSSKRYLVDTAINISVENVQNCKGSFYDAHLKTVVDEFREQITDQKSAYLAKVVSRNQGGFIVNIKGIKAFLPGSLAAANKIVDFDDYLGKELYVMVEDYLAASDMFVVSYKKYLEKILPTKINNLEKGSVLNGIVTGTSKFGIFVEFEEIYTGLLHITEMSETTKQDFQDGQYRPGDEIEIWLKDVRDNKLILTDIDPAEKEAEMEDFKSKNEGLVKSLQIVSVKPFGVLMEVEKGVLGLLPIKDAKRAERKGAKLINGERITVCVKKVDSTTGKIYLTLLDDNVPATA